MILSSLCSVGGDAGLCLPQRSLITYLFVCIFVFANQYLCIFGGYAGLEGVVGLPQRSGSPMHREAKMIKCRFTFKILSWPAALTKSWSGF